MTVADRLTVMATGAAVAVSIVGGSCSTNARIGDIQAAMRELRLDMRAEHDTLRADMRAEHNTMRAEHDAIRADMRAEHDAIRVEIRRLGDRMRVIEITLGVPGADAPPPDTRR